ncbi:YajD family HNH nuclease [Thermodesulfobacteriota bacterium]
MNKKKTKGSRLGSVLTEAQRYREKRSTEYRDLALKMYPHICGRCGREFSGKRLRELTVHHKDHDHENNPSDGSNWELLCIYCHDMEHQRELDEEDYRYETQGKDRDPAASYKPFAALQDLLKDKE